LPLRNEEFGMMEEMEGGGRRLNTCTRCPLRTSSSRLRVCRAKIESYDDDEYPPPRRHSAYDMCDF